MNDPAILEMMFRACLLYPMACMCMYGIINLILVRGHEHLAVRFDPIIKSASISAWLASVAIEAARYIMGA